MSNETKRNVFGQLLNAYQNLFMKDIEIPDDSYRENITTPWNIAYDDALPDDLPVIPKKVACLIKQYKEWNCNLGIVFDDACSNHIWEDGVGEWILEHPEMFARAWVLGVWRVEETGDVAKLQV